MRHTNCIKSELIIYYLQIKFFVETILMPNNLLVCWYICRNQWLPTQFAKCCTFSFCINKIDDYLDEFFYSRGKAFFHNIYRNFKLRVQIVICITIVIINLPINFPRYRINIIFNVCLNLYAVNINTCSVVSLRVIAINVSSLARYVIVFNQFPLH